MQLNTNNMAFLSTRSGLSSECKYENECEVESAAYEKSEIMLRVDLVVGHAGEMERGMKER